MTDLVSQFTAMLGQSAPGGSIAFLVAQLGDEQEVVRRCAITHQFNAELLRVLDPSLDEEAASDRFHRLARLSLCTRSPDGLALHDRARAQLFAEWLVPERAEELREISTRLAAYFSARIESAAGAERETLARRRLFHSIAVDQDAGIDQFESEFEAARDRARYTACDNVLRMVHEYDAILTPPNQARVAYRAGKLALDRGAPEQALELFRRVVSEPAATLVHRAKALNGIGLAHADLCHWKNAATAFLEALRFAEEHEETRPFRSGFLLNLAAVYRDTGYVEAAKALLSAAAKMAAGSTHEKMAALVGNAFGTLYLRSGEAEKAIAYLEESLGHLPADDFARARVYNNLGLASMRVPDLTASEAWFTRSLEMKTLAGDSIGQANTHINLVRLYREQNAADKAVASAAIAADLFARVSLWKQAGDAYALLARFYLEGEKLAETAQAATAAFIAYERAHADDERALLRKEILQQRPSDPMRTDDADLVAQRLAQLNGEGFATGRKPIVATLLSLLVVGAGQFYNGDVIKGVVMLLVAVVAGAFTLTIGWFVVAILSAIDAWAVAARKRRRWTGTGRWFGK